MSDGLPNFQANNLGGSAFQSFAGFGFSLGNLDPFNPNALRPNNGLINSDGNTQNQKPKKGKGKIMNKKKGKDLSVSEAAPQEVSDFGANDENSNSMGFNNQIMKAPKQIRKQTLQKLQKRSQKSNNLSGRNADRFSSSNRGRFNRGPAKALNSGMFFKTKICPHFIEGNCRRGDSCNYAHSQNELQIVPNLKKTKICQLYQIGKCNMGNACSFAHGDQELRSTPEFFKTSLCHAFMKGTCKAGENCRYAHGESDLRSGPFPVNNSMPMKNMNNNNPAGFNLHFPQVQPQPEPFNPPPQMYQNNYSLPPSNFGFDNVAFQPFINQQPQQPLNTTVVSQEPLPEIKFGSFDPSKLGALWNPNSNNMNFYN